MRLSLTLAEAELVVQEPVGVTVRLINDGEAPVAFPYEHSSMAVTTLRLFDRDRQLMGEANGYTRDIRQGLDILPGDPATLMTTQIPPGDDIEWSEDLLVYFDIDRPGEYFVQVRVDFPPSAIDVESEVLPFSVVPMRCTSFDVVVDRVAMSVLHVVQQQDDRAIAQFRSTAVASTSWSGVSIRPAPQGIARISEADFATRETYDHDFFRWIAWLDDGKLALASIREGAPITMAVSDAASKDAMMIGRPVQHADGGVSIWIVENAITLRRLDFDEKGILKGSAVIDTIATTADPISAACDRKGSFFIVAANHRAFPLTVRQFMSDASASAYSLASPFAPRQDEGRIFALRLDMKTDATPSLLVGVQYEDAIEAGHLRSDWRTAQFATGDWLQKDERWTTGDVIADLDGNLHCVMATSKGRIIHWRDEKPARVVASTPDLIESPLRLAMAGGLPHVFYADHKSGVLVRRIDA